MPFQGKNAGRPGDGFSYAIAQCEAPRYAFVNFWLSCQPVPASRGPQRLISHEAASDGLLTALASTLAFNGSGTLTVTFGV
jgi:hypothetical protein